MVEKKYFGVVSYTLGVISIVMAFFTPLAGLIFGVIGFKLNKKQKKENRDSRKLNLIGIVLGAVLSILQIALAIYFTVTGLSSLPSFQ